MEMRGEVVVFLLLTVLFPSLSSLQDEKVASNLITSILLEMLASPLDDIKVHAFNLLFNLSVHMNLLDETSLLGESTGKAMRSTDTLALMNG